MNGHKIRPVLLRLFAYTDETTTCTAQQGVRYAYCYRITVAIDKKGLQYYPDDTIYHRVKAH